MASSDRASSGSSRGNRDPSVRPPAVAGTFYPADAGECRSAAESLLRPHPDVPRRGETRDAVGVRLRGAIVPHAGWVCSGAIAGEAIATLARSGGRAPPDVVVVFGAIHTALPTSSAALCSQSTWREPGGDSPVATEVGAKLAEGPGGLFAVDDRFHRREHAVEVELPLIQAAWPGAAILPVEVPVVEQAVEIGRRVAREIVAAGPDAVLLASSDLTHYGPAYRFAPAGVGPQGLAWAKGNDRRLIDRVLAFDPDGIVPEVKEHLNACGGGAIAAMLAACRELGASSATLLRHANSFETLADVYPQPATDAVGYAGMVIG